MADPHLDRLDTLASYLATGSGSGPRAPALPPSEQRRLDLVRALLADEAMWSAPPPELVDDVIDRIDGEGRVRRRWARPMLGGLAAAAAVLVVALFVAGRGTIGDDADSGARDTALAGTELAPAASATARVRSTPSGVAITLHVEGLAPAPAHSYYQGWVKGPAGLVAIGTFHVREGDDDPIELWSGVDLEDYPDLTVTLEPEDGDPASSGQRVLTGSL